MSELSLWSLVPRQQEESTVRDVPAITETEVYTRSNTGKLNKDLCLPVVM